ncbi:MAG: ribosome small subunit-dependent GTPase A [Anaerolineae bacterium]|nr:ribosome small subunit-dependent GTPase A [Anaerolineae bacterium]
MGPFAQQESNGTREGIVFRKSLGTYTVHTKDEIVQCAISSKLRKHLEYWWDVSQSPGMHKRVKEVHDIREVDPVAIGDVVRFVETPNDRDEGLIIEVLPRRNAFSRPAAGRKPIEQVIVANVDQVMPVLAAREPKPKWRQLDHYIAAAEFAGVPSVVCINKIDLARTDDGIDEIAAVYERIGYRVLLTSAATGEGIDTFAETLRGRVTALTGRSGVGKTSLLNRIQPELGLRVGEVSQATGKGRHVTSQLEMFPLADGGSIVDTPGMREFEIWHEPAEGGLASLFVEMRPYIGQCRFGLDCEHRYEPGCAIKEATEAGEIAQMRYDSYIHVLRHMPGQRR